MFVRYDNNNCDISTHLLMVCHFVEACMVL